jgi:hypothetical protein
MNYPSVGLIRGLKKKKILLVPTRGSFDMQISLAQVMVGGSW